MKLSGVLMMAFVVSAVTVMLNRWGHSFVPSFVLSLAASSLSFLFSVRPSATHQKTLKPPPSAVCHWDHEELPSLPSSVYPLSEHAFLEGRLLFIPSGGLTVNLLHWGEISGSGANGCGLFWINPSFWKSLYTRICFCFPSIPLSHLSIHPSTHPLTGQRRHTPSLSSPSSFSLLLFSGRIIGQASTSFHFQPQQTERLH